MEELRKAIVETNRTVLVMQATLADHLVEAEKVVSNHVRLDRTINLGHIITFIGFIVTIFVTWTALDKRVVVLEEAAKAQHALDLGQDQRTNERMSEIKDTLTEIKRSVEGVREKLERRL